MTNGNHVDHETPPVVSQPNQRSPIGFFRKFWNEWVWPLRYHIVIIAVSALGLILLSKLS